MLAEYQVLEKAKNFNFICKNNFITFLVTHF